MPVTPNEFLLRRQFLMMERKRTENLIAQAKAELQAQQRQLLAVRSQFQDVLALEETADADVENWRAPAPRTAFAWADFIKTLTPELAINVLKSHTQRPQVAYCVGGGLGDVLKSTAILAEVVDRLNCDITYFTDQIASLEILKSNKYVSNVVFMKNIHAQHFGDSVLKYIEHFDYVVNWRYIASFFSSKKQEGEIFVNPQTKEDGEKIFHDLEKFVKYNHSWPKWNYSLYRMMIRNNLSAIGASQFSLGLESSEKSYFRPSFNLADHSPTPWLHRLNFPYITIHHGFDLRSLPDRPHPTDYQSTKTLPRKTWRAIVAGIRAAGFKVVQLGTTEEEEIPGVDLYLNGQTTLAESALIIKSALCHVDTEGGLVHLAHAMHQRSVVLFGPTPVQIFGYSENINLEPNTCKGCWFATETWLVECPRRTKGPQCMKEHRAEDVVNAINRIVQDRPKEMALCLELVTSTDSRDAVAQLSALRAEYSKNSPGERLVLIDQADADIDAYRQRNNSEHERIAYFASHAPNIARDRREYNIISPLSLPDDDVSFDLVTCISAVWATDDAPFLLREVFRVLKADGVLIAGVPNGVTVPIDLHALLHDARLTRQGDWPAARTGTLFALKKRHTPSGQTRESTEPRPFEVTQCAPALIPAESQESMDLNINIAALEDENSDTFEKASKAFDEAKCLADRSWRMIATALSRATRQQGWIECRSGFCDNYSQHLLLDGWSGIEDWGCWSIGPASRILLPFTPKIEDEETLEIELDLVRPPRDGQVPLTLTLAMAGRPLTVTTCKPENLLRLEIPANAVDCASFALLCLEVSATTRPSLWGLNAHDHRELGIGLRRFRYRTYEAPAPSTSISKTKHHLTRTLFRI